MKTKNFSFLFYLLIGILLILPVIPFFHKGYFPTHDGEWAVIRLSDMFREVRDWQIPARFSGNLNFGYGYPLFNFTYPFPYYLGLPFVFFKLGFVNTIKIMFALTVPLSFLGMYLLSKNLWKSSFVGVVSGITYVYLPYRMVDLYVRGSIGESISFVLFPFIVWGIKEMKETKNQNIYLAFTSILVSLLILTHNIMAVLFAPVIFISIFLFNFKNGKIKLSSFYPVFGGLLLSAFFWMPALLERKNILLSRIPIADRSLYFASIQQLVVPHWGYGVPIEKNGFSYQLGIAQILGLLLCLAFFIKEWRKNENKQLGVLLSSIFGMLVLLFPFSEFIWRGTPLLSEINYQWTLLAPIGFLISLAIGFISMRKKWIGVIVATVSVIFVLPYAKPLYFLDRGDMFYVTNDATTTSSSELMPLWVLDKPQKRYEQKMEIVKGKGNLQTIFLSSKKITGSVEIFRDAILQNNTIYYPGWKAYIDKIKTDISYNNPYGIMQISVPKGKHVILFQFEETTQRLFADIISLLSWVFIVSYLGYALRKKYL